MHAGPRRLPERVGDPVNGAPAIHGRGTQASDLWKTMSGELPCGQLTIPRVGP